MNRTFAALSCALALLAIQAGCASVSGPRPAPTAEPRVGYAPARPESIWIVPRSAAAGGGLYATDTSERAVQLDRMSVDVATHGPLASIRVSQRFSNTTAENAGLDYRLPLPSGALVSEFAMRVGDRHLRGIILPREDAERMYALARERQLSVHLAETEGETWYHLASVAAGTELAVEFEYVQGLAREDGGYELALDPRAWGTGFDLEVRARLDLGLPIEPVGVSHDETVLLSPHPNTLDVRYAAEVGGETDEGFGGPAGPGLFSVRFRPAPGAPPTTLYRAPDSAGGEDYWLEWHHVPTATDRNVIQGLGAVHRIATGGRYLGRVGRLPKASPVAAAGIVDVGRPLELAWTLLEIRALGARWSESVDPAERALRLEELRALALGRALVTPWTGFAIVDATR